ncbi:MAG: hypothetical protein AAB397_03400 [Patescibacteria group bacterium]
MFILPHNIIFSLLILITLNYEIHCFPPRPVCLRQTGRGGIFTNFAYFVIQINRML